MIDQRILFRLAGVVWGTVAALIAGAGTAAAAFIAAWAFVLGDHHWPPLVFRVVGAMASLPAIAAFVVAMVLANAGARQTAALPAVVGRRRAMSWLGSGAGALGILVLGSAAWTTRERHAAEDARALESRYQALAAAVHAPSSVILEVAPDTVIITASIEGRRSGSYRLVTRLAASFGKRALAERTETVELGPGLVKHTVTFDTPAVLDAYRRELLSGGLGAVDQHLVAEITLDPQVSGVEASLASGRLPLARSRRATTRVAFVAAPDGNRLLP